MEPVMKWAGGKRQILSYLKQIIPSDVLAGHTYYEPFVGGGSVFLSLAHDRAVVNDSNPELVNVYVQMRDNPDEIIELLKEHKKRHCRDYYYEIRDWDRDEHFYERDAIVRAARTIYLNRTCFNGLYRVNRSGYFNVPLGSYTSPQIVRELQIKEISEYLNNNDIQILCGDFEEAVANAKQGDVVYLDPPYDYDDDCAEGFVRYTADQFSREELYRLGTVCDNLLERGCYIVISNNDTECVREVFSLDKYVHFPILGRRMINNTSEKRHGVDEVIILGVK